MKRFLIIAALLTGFAAPPVGAQTRVGDWTVEKRAQDTHCNASRGYKDPDDDNRNYAIVLTYSSEKIVVVVVYDGWEWEKKGEILRADFSSDKEDIMKKAQWEVMDKTTVRGVFEYNQSILDMLNRAKLLSIDFEDDEDNSIDLQTPRAGEALAALKYCEENRK